GLVLFASEMKALLVCPELRRTLDPTAIEDYFAYGYVPESKAIYRDVAKVPPGHVLVVRRGRKVPTPTPYWDLPFSEPKQADEAAVAEELIPRLRDAVKMRLISEVPLGAFLSGGVDSSAVVAMMAECADRVDSFSIGFTQAAYDESSYAERIAAQFKTRHY